MQNASNGNENFSKMKGLKRKYKRKKKNERIEKKSVPKNFANFEKLSNLVHFYDISSKLISFSDFIKGLLRNTFNWFNSTN